MNNEIQRKITSLTLMAIMLAGGMAIASPGMEPAYAAPGDLYVSANEVGNFAGIQVIEIVVDDPNRSDTSESQGIPNVEINGDDVLMAQANDGAWYGYVANQLAITTYGTVGITALYGATANPTGLDGSDAVNSFYNVEAFLDGFKDLSATVSTGSTFASNTATLTNVVGEVNATATIVVGTVLTNIEAFGTITAAGEITAGDTVTIDTTTFTATAGVGGGAGSGDFNITPSGAGLDIASLLAEIQANTGTNTIVTSSSPTATTILITAVDGTTAAAGNLIASTDSSGTVTFGAVTLTGGVDADTVTLNSVVYTAVLGTAGANEFEVTGGATGTATTLALILDSTEALVTATSGGTTTVTITAIAAGTAGNGITLASSDDAGRLNLGGESATGNGLDSDTITINGLTYAAVVGTASDNTEFSRDGSDPADAIALAAAITSRDSSTVTAITVGTNVVTITAIVSGSAGNAITLAVSSATIVIPNPNLIGGVTGTTTFDNNPAIDDSTWPFIQTYNISENSDVSITYGTGSTADKIIVVYDYDDDKDISLDRQRYPTGSFVFIDLDDSLLNLSPIAEDYWLFGDNGNTILYKVGSASSIAITDFAGLGFEEGPFKFDIGSPVYKLTNTEILSGSLENTVNAVIFRESDDNDNIFVNYDRSDKSNLVITGNGEASVSYNNAHSIIQDTFNGAIKYLVTIDEWLSGVELGVQLMDEDRNLNTRIDETINILGGEVPYIKIGAPLHLNDLTIVDTTVIANGTASEVFDVTTTATTVTLNGTWAYDAVNTNNGYIYTYLNYDLSELGGGKGLFYMGSEDASLSADSLNNAILTTDANSGTFQIAFTVTDATSGQAYVDVFSFGQTGDISNSNANPFTGDIESAVRVNDAIYRFELEETDENTATYTGTVEYIMINQLNVFDEGTYDNIETTGDEIVMIVNDDLDGADAIRISYNDKDSTNNDETISAQEDANTHTGKISLDKVSYSAGNTITVTLEDSDLNTDSDTIQTYDVFNSQNWIGNNDVWLVKLLIDDTLYDGSCASNLGLNSTGLTLIETDDESGVFVGTLKLPSLYCDSTTTNSTTNGKDLEFEYQDFADASGESNESSTSVSVRSITGTVNLDTTVYGVPIADAKFKLYDHTTANPSYLEATSTKLVIRVDDPDYNISASGEDTLDASNITVELSRSGDKVTIPISSAPLIEIAPDAGIFELEVLIPQGNYFTSKVGDKQFVQQGDIITVTYRDTSDASGSINTVTDSATFDLRNGVLQADKSVYIIGSDAIITLIEPDLNLDSETAETWSLKLVNWDSDAGEKDLSYDKFDAQPTGFRETGDNTGIFQVVIEIPKDIDGDKLERGEQIELEYTDYGPAGADYVGDDDEEVKLIIYTSNFGATVELDQKVYSWTDKVYITVVAPDHNFDSDSIDEIGNNRDSAVNISTREDKIEEYKLVETGTDTGIFTGEVILTGFTHDADGSTATGDIQGNDVIFASASADRSGPTDGKLPTGSDDGMTVSFEFSDGETAYGSALIRWSIGEVQWLEASYPASGSGLVRVIDSDMNFNPEAVDSFNIDVWSDTDAGGITLSVTETNEATGIFEGAVFFTTTDASSGSRLAVSEGDTVIAEYEDNTLPDPYSNADELEITATTLIGTLVPPLERAPVANLRAVDAFGNSLSSVQIDQQVQVTADLSNGQDRTQEFAYLLQVQNEDGVTVSLSWITGSLEPGQSFSPAVSWIPQEMGMYDATVFVWESVDNPTALSPPNSTTITVS